MKRRPTIVDVAKHAGISKSTVSLVLRNSQSVREHTRDKVRQAMRETGYVYNRGAANMRAEHAGLVGLIINDLRNPFYTELVVSTQMELADRGYAAVVANSNEDEDLQSQIIETMLEHGVDALVIAPSYGDDETKLHRLTEIGIPVIQALRQTSFKSDAVPLCSMDYENGSRLAAGHLFSENTSKVAFVGGLEDRPITRERRIGYIEKVQQLGLEPILFHGATSRAFGYQTARKIAKERPEINAAMAFNDQIALGMMAGLAAEGISVGKNFRLVGFDDIEEAAQSYPRLSTVRCDINAFGKWTISLLLNWLENKQHPGTPARMPVELVVRETS